MWCRLQAEQSCPQLVGAGAFLCHSLCALAVWGGAVCARLHKATWLPCGSSGPDKTGMIQSRLGPLHTDPRVGACGQLAERFLGARFLRLPGWLGHCRPPMGWRRLQLWLLSVPSLSANELAFQVLAIPCTVCAPPGSECPTIYSQLLERHRLLF